EAACGASSDHLSRPTLTGARATPPRRLDSAPFAWWLNELRYRPACAAAGRRSSPPEGDRRDNPSLRADGRWWLEIPLLKGANDGPDVAGVRRQEAPLLRAQR